MELDDFISRVNQLTKPALLEEKVRLEVAIARIQLQLQTPRPRTESSLLDWKKSARTALRFKQIELQYVNDRLQLTPCPCPCDSFVETAKRLLDPDTFNIIMEQATT